MILRRWVAPLCVLALSVFATSSRAENSPSLAPLAHSDPAAVQKDDSHLTVVEAGNSDDTPILDTASKKKKPVSFWSKLSHPTKWFSSSTPKKK
jgi:hypothetical protein